MLIAEATAKVKPPTFQGETRQASRCATAATVSQPIRAAGEEEQREGEPGGKDWELRPNSLVWSSLAASSLCYQAEPLFSGDAPCSGFESEE